MTKILLRILLTLVALYVAAWLFVGAYVSQIMADHTRLHNSLVGSFDGRAVSFANAKLYWREGRVHLLLEQLEVAGDTPEMPVLAFERLSARINPWSFFWLWPAIEGLALDSPTIEIDTSNAGATRIAGFTLGQGGLDSSDKRRVLRWLLDQRNVAVHDGTVVWRKANGQVQRYTDMNFVFARLREDRSVTAVATSEKGSLAIKLTTQGDIVEQSEWDAELAVLGGGVKPLFGRDDLEVAVSDGVGQLRLKALDLERITDFLSLLDAGGQTQWFLDANVGGRLTDVRFMFSGPLLDFDSWSLKARVQELSVNPAAGDGRFPRLNGLAGELEAYPERGELRFVADDAAFEWARYFDYSFPIDLAAGSIDWRNLDDGRVQINLQEAQFKDAAVWVQGLTGTALIGTATEQISSFVELFEVGSIRELEFAKGGVVAPTQGLTAGALHIDARAQFEIFNLDLLDRYIPTIAQTQKLKTWWENAFQAGSASRGQVAFAGVLDQASLRSGESKLSASADFADVLLDYGYQRQWPKIERANGTIQLADGTLTVAAEQAYLDGDQVLNSDVRIVDVLLPERQLEISGRVSTSFAKATQLILQGPLFEPQNRPSELPFVVTNGTVDIDVALSLPLGDVNAATLAGTAQVHDAALTLTGGVPVRDITTQVRFTQDTAESDPMMVAFLGGESTVQLETIESGKPPKLRLTASGDLLMPALTPWLGEHLTARLEGSTEWQGEILFDVPQVLILGRADLVGTRINAPQPLRKSAAQALELNLEMRFGNANMQQTIDLKLADRARVQLRQNPRSLTGDSTQGLDSSFFDAAEISLGHLRGMNQRPGVNFNIDAARINLDDWVETIIEISSFEASQLVENTQFLDAMRRIDIRADNPILLGRQFGAFELTASSSDGHYWFGHVAGDRVVGNLQMEPRAPVSQFRLDLDKLHLDQEPEDVNELLPVDPSLSTRNYPALDINIEDFKLVDMALGKLTLRAAPMGDAWVIDHLSLEDQGLITTGSGQWRNSAEQGSVTQIDFDADIQAAGKALDSLDFAGFLRKGEGYANGRLEWQGAPHEFDYSRLNGDFDIRIKDGELTQVAPGTGRLLGLLNFNAILRRVTLDFSDVLASGLKFDQMQYTGIFAEGEAIMRDAYLFSPAVFVRMEGKLDLDKELIDMEMHLSPELGGNLTLLSALANPAAGAVMFLLQNMFKDEMRSSSFVSYRAKGAWADFELVEIDGSSLDLEEPRLGEFGIGEAANSEIDLGTVTAHPTPELLKSPQRAGH